MQSLRIRIFTGITLPLILALITLGVALSIPRSGIQFTSADSHLIAMIPDTGSGSSNTFQAEEVLSFKALEASFPADTLLIIEEPDVLETHTEMRLLMQRIDILTRALNAAQLTMHTESGEYLLQLQKPTLTALPLGFWIQLGAGVAALIICVLVWLPGNVSTGKYGFIITGLAYFLTLATAGLYSSRELFINGDLFRYLSLMNTFSTYLFMSGLSLLFWNYPRQLLSRRINIILAVFPLLLIIFAAIPVHEHLAITIYLPFTLLLLLPLCGMIMQWRKNADNPKNRAILRWILFMLVAVIIPAILKLYAPVPQSVLLVSVVFVYAGIMVGITRHQMFDIERWSYRLWAWFLGGIAVLLTDLALATLIGLSQETSLVLAMAIVGWLYFPLRQWAWRRFFERQHNHLEEWLSLSVPELLSQRMEEAHVSNTPKRLESALTAVFHPLKIERDGANRSEGVHQKSTQMTISCSTDETITLYYPAEGRRHFSQHDLSIAHMILALDDLITHSLSARAEGAREERHRIRQDLHDDLGAKLLRLLHRSPPDDKPLVREAINDLRVLLQNTQGQGESINDILKRWQEEATARCRDHEVKLEWRQSPGNARISAAAIMHTGRALREAISNAIRNMSTPELRINIEQDNQRLMLTITNQFSDEEKSERTGEGIENIHQRMQLIGGLAEITTEIHGPKQTWNVRLMIPLIETETVG